MVENISTRVPAESVEQAFITTRILNASRDVVFKAWSEADRLAQWWGPKGFSLEVRKLDFRPDGVFHYALHMPKTGNANGQPAAEEPAMWGRFVYRDIVPPERIVFTSGFSNEAGSAARAPFSDEFPLEVLNTVTFEEKEPGKTTMTLRGLPFNATAQERQMFEGMFESMTQGFGGTWDQLADYLAKS